MDKKNLKAILIIAIIFSVIFSIYLIINNVINKKEESVYLKNYKANEYIKTYISDETMAKIYFSDYLNYLYYNIDEAYNLLDNEYREKKFGSSQNFKNYINSIDLNSVEVKSFAIKDKGGYEYIYIYDKNDRLYIFKTKGVMQYKVYLDETTVNI